MSIYFFTYTQRMSVCFGHVIDDCKTVSISRGEEARAFLGLTHKYKKSDDALRKRIDNNECFVAGIQHDHFGAGMPEVFSWNEYKTFFHEFSIEERANVARYQQEKITAEDLLNPSLLFGKWVRRMMSQRALERRNV